MGEPKRLLPALIWSIVAAIFKGLPFSFLFAAIWLLFEPLSNGSSPELSKLLAVSGGLAVSLVLQFFITRKTEMTANGDTYFMVADGRVKLGEHLKKLSMGFYCGQDPGDLIAVLLQDYQNIEMVISHTLPSIVSAIVAPLLVLIALFFLDPQMALITAAVIPLAVPVILLTRKLAITLGEKQMSGKVRLANSVLEFVQGFKAVKAFNLQGKKLNEFEENVEAFRKESIALEAGLAPTVILGSFIIQAGFAVLILSGITLLVNQEITIFKVLVFIIIGGRVYDPLSSALLYSALLNYLGLSAKNVEKTLNTQTLSEPAVMRTPTGSDIEFHSVSFSYGSIPVLKNISFTSQAGTMTALVGPSGSGKTTITRLIARFWDVCEGSVSFGGYNVKDLQTESLLSKISMVFQDVYLFNNSILENIRMGREDATDSEVIDAAKRAQCHQFISELPEGYGTLAGEGGCRLSGGEKQRISIARALLKDAPVILLDEATASLDPENEYQIQQALSELVKDKTIIIIAHRLQTVVNADQIIVMNEGEIIEKGAHTELLETKGLYCELWKEQQRNRGWRFAEKHKVITDDIKELV